MRTGDEVGSAKQVDEKVAGHTTAVGFPLAPLEEMLGIEGNFGRRAQKSWPVTCLGRSIQRHRVVPGPNRRVAIPPRSHHIQLADGAGGKQFLRFGIDHRADPLASDLDDPVGRARSLDHLWAVGIQMDHGLLAINILAGLHGVHGHLLVPVVGRANDHGVDVFSLQNLGVIAGGKNIVTPEFLAVGEPAIVAIRNCNELHSGNLQGDTSITLALPSGADQCDLNMIVCRNGLGRLRLSLRQQMRS